MNQEVIVFSVPRSAGTLVSDLVGEVLKKPVQDSHTYEVVRDKVIICVRDFRDCVASYFQKETGLPQPSLPSLLYYSFLIKRYVKVLDEYEGRGALYLKYEKFLNNFDYIFDRLEEFFNIKINKSTRRKLKQKYSIDTFNPNMGKSQKWKTIIPKQYHTLVYLYFRNYLLKYGYSRRGT